MVCIPLPPFVSNHRTTSCSGSVNDCWYISPLFPSRRMKRHVPCSVELLCFIKRAILQGGVHNDCRSYRAGSTTVDLNVSSNSLHLFILLASSQSGHIISRRSSFPRFAPLDLMTIYCLCAPYYTFIALYFNQSLTSNHYFLFTMVPSSLC